MRLVIALIQALIQAVFILTASLQWFLPQIFSSPVLRGNYSGFLIINLSVYDLVGVQHVLFNVTNSSGIQNATYVASQLGNSWNVSLNTSHFPGGYYNLTVYANDSLNNLNNTGQIINIIFDNTNPSGSFSCSSDDVYEGDSLTCSCSGSDTFSGVLSTNYDASPSTSSTGDFTTTCTLTDYAGNSIEYTFAYSVVTSSSSGSSSSGGSSGSSSSLSLPSISSSLSVSKQNIGNGFRARFSNNSKIVFNTTLSGDSNEEQHSFQVKNIETSTILVEISSDPIIFSVNKGEVKKVDLDEDGIYDFSVKFNEVVAGRADIEFTQIEESVNSNSIDNSDIVDETLGNDNSGTNASESNVGNENGGNSLWILFVVIIIILVTTGLIILYLNKDKLKKNNSDKTLK